MDNVDKYSLAELSRISGVRPRTIRDYIRRNLVPPPEGKGRGSYYSKAHLDRLLKIISLKNEGLSLAEVGKKLDVQRIENSNEEIQRLDREITTRIRLAEGIVLEISHDAALPSPAVLQKMSDMCGRPMKKKPSKSYSKPFTVKNLTPGPLLIPDGRGTNQTLRLRCGEKVEIKEVTPTISNAQKQGLITISKD